jgi:hypothetical protein
MENFQNLDEQQVNGAVETDSKKKEKNEKLKAMSALLRDTVNQDPTFATKVRSLSDKLAVVNTLGYGENGNIIVDEATKNLPKDQRKLVTTSQIVGYRVQNIGDAPVKYLTEEFTKDAEGVFVGARVEKTAKPGEFIDLTRKYMTIFCSQPEISFSCPMVRSYVVPVLLSRATLTENSKLITSRSTTRTLRLTATP